MVFEDGCVEGGNEAFEDGCVEGETRRLWMDVSREETRGMRMEGEGIRGITEEGLGGGVGGGPVEDSLGMMTGLRIGRGGRCRQCADHPDG